MKTVEEARAGVVEAAADLAAGKLPGAIDDLIRAVRAEMPCYRRWFADDAGMPTCLDVSGDHPRCPSCKAREDG